MLSATGPGVFAVDTVRFTVRPGAPARLEILPRDSAVYVDRSYSIRARVLDGHGNPSAVAPTLRSDSGAVTLTAQGVLTGARVGRAVVRAAFERLADSAWVSVVPRGTLAATRRPGELVQFGLDGSDVGVLAARAVGEATWAPAGGGMAFVDRSQGDYFYGGRVFVRDAGGAEAPLLADYTPYETQRTPAFSRDGAWVYFAGRATHTSIMRARLNGGGLEAVATPAPPGSPWYTDTSAAPDGAYHSYADPAPSPDGRYLAYSGLASCCVPWVIYVRELATGRTTKRPGAELPKWLPGTDTLVAHSAAGFVLVRPDGSTVRSVAYPAVTTLGGMLFDVAPDGRWLAVSANIEGPSRRIELLSLETGMRLPLAFTTDMGSPAWRP